MLSFRRSSGFTLIELVAVVIIVGILAAICIAPALTASIQIAHAQDAQANLMAIYAAQLNYNNNNGSYCDIYSTPTKCDSTPDINTALGLSIVTNGWSYQCPNYNTTPACTGTCTACTTTSCTCTGGSPGQVCAICTATSTTIGGFYLILANSPIILTGSGTHNPSCYGNKSYCANI